MTGIRAGHIVTQADLTDGMGLIVRKSVIETVTNSTTFQDDDELRFAVAANTDYIFDGWIKYTAASATGNIKVRFTGPTGATGEWTNFGANVGSPAAYNVVTETIPAVTQRSMPGNSPATTPMSFRPTGQLSVAGTSGFLTMQFAQDSANITTGTSVHPGSWLRLQKVL